MLSELYIGIMSGTSLDGIDAALVDLSGPKPQLKGTHYQPYPAELKETLLELHRPGQNELHLAQITSNQLARAYAQTVLGLLQETGTAHTAVRAIGCHGQTIRHRPEMGYTIQLGNHALLAELTGIDVIGDFRSRDIAAGGQGAPLVPAFHNHVLRAQQTHRVIVNIGGISNLTNLSTDGGITGFDCGPGNLLMDAWIYAHQGKAYDKDGSWAASGTVMPELLAHLLDEQFFHASPPKSSGRDLFNMDWLKQKLTGQEKPADVQATLLALTGKSIADAVRQYCGGAQEIYLCGGGAHNTALQNYLAHELPQTRLEKTDVLGVDADWLEAIAFAWFAQQTIHGKPANLPAVTGAKHPCIQGAIYQA